ncbi:hypothetical protein MRX96_052094 [Rhipicephalus microplus]
MACFLQIPFLQVQLAIQGVCPHRLLSSVQPLLRYLVLLVPSLAELEQERQRLRQELSRLQDARQLPPCGT